MKTRAIHAFLGLLAAAPAQAADGGGLKSASIFSGGGVDVGLSLGVMSASAREIVFATAGDGSGLAPGAHVSQLDWRMKAAPVMGLKLGAQIRPTTRLETSLVAPFAGANAMTDTDWLSPSAYPAWTDRSISDDTRLGATFTTDLKLVQRVYASGGFETQAMLGWRHSQMTWKAYGGTFVYTEASPDACHDYGAAQYNGASAFRNCIGAFSNGALISYRQRFDTPYAGLRLSYETGALRLSGDLIGSPFGWSSDRDNHIGATLFTDRFRQQAMLGATIELSYALSQTFLGFVEAENQTWFKRKGVGDATDQTTGDYANFGPGSAGISLQTLRLSMGVKARF